MRKFSWMTILSLLLACLVSAIAGGEGSATQEPNASAASKPETPELDDIVRKEIERSLVADGLRKAEARNLLGKADSLIELGKYEEARVLLEKASALDPDSEQVRERLKTLANYLPTQGSDTKGIINDNVKRQEIRQLLYSSEVKMLLGQASQALQRAVALSAENASIDDITNAIMELDRATEAVRRANYKLKSLPSSVDSSAEASEAINLEKTATDMRKALEGRADGMKLTAAADAKHKDAKQADDYQKQQVDLLMKRAHEHHRLRQYDEAEAVLAEVLRLNPVHEEAARMSISIRDERNRYLDAKYRDFSKWARIAVMQNIESTSIPPTRTITYPNDWSELTMRKDTERRQGGSGAVPEWKLKILQRLEQPVNINFEETPLAEVLKYLTSITGVDFIIDSKIEGGAEKPVNMTVTDMRLEDVLKHITDILDLSYDLTNRVIYISQHSESAGNWYNHVYDVADLANEIKDAPDEMNADDDDDDDDDDDANSLKIDEIVKKIKPETWGDNKGSVLLQGNDLIILQTDEVHKLIEQTLAQLRAAQAIQVAVTARFLNVQDDFWEVFSGSIGSFTGSTKGNSSVTGSQSNNAFTGLMSVMGSNLGSSTATTTGMTTTVSQSGWLSNLQATWTLQMLKETSKADELFAPNLIMYNNRQAWLHISTEIAYITSYSGSSGNFTPNVRYVDEGTVLQVRPFVSSDKKYITLNLQTKVSKLLSMAKEMLTQEYTTDTIYYYDSWGRFLYSSSITASTELQIDLPTTFIHETRTFATLPDGGAILISGLSINVNYKGKNGIPILSEIPVFGNSISARALQKEKRNMVIMVSARMLLLDEEEAKYTR